MFDSPQVINFMSHLYQISAVIFLKIPQHQVISIFKNQDTYPIITTHLGSEPKSTTEFEFFTSLSLFPSCAALVIGPFKSETFRARLSCLRFRAIHICRARDWSDVHRFRADIKISSGSATYFHRN